MKNRFGQLPLLGLVMLIACDATDVSAPPEGALVLSRSTVASVVLPGDGNGGKDVVEVFIQNPVNCGGTVLTRTVTGWIQTNPRENGESGIQQLAVYRVDYVFSNAAGETFVIRETGIDQIRIEDGVEMILIAGKTPRHSGVIRFNRTTGEQTFEAGPDYDLPRNRACDALA